VRVSGLAAWLACFAAHDRCRLAFSLTCCLTWGVLSRRRLVRRGQHRWRRRCLRKRRVGCRRAAARPAEVVRPPARRRYRFALVSTRVATGSEPVAGRAGRPELALAGPRSSAERLDDQRPLRRPSRAAHLAPLQASTAVGSATGVTVGDRALDSPRSNKWGKLAATACEIDRRQRSAIGESDLRSRDPVRRTDRAVDEALHTST